MNPLRHFAGPLRFYRFKAATTILNKVNACQAVPAAYVPSTFVKRFKAPKVMKPPQVTGGYIPKTEILAIDDPPVAGPSKMLYGPAPSATGKTIAQSSFYAAPKQTPDRIFQGEKSNKDRLMWGGALHDPKAEGAIVMQRPDQDSIQAKEQTRK